MTPKKKENNFIAFISAIFCGFQQFDISFGTAGVGADNNVTRAL